MDGSGFDDLTRSWARPSSRRRSLKLLLVGIFGGSLTGLASWEAGKARKKPRRKNSRPARKRGERGKNAGNGRRTGAAARAVAAEAVPSMAIPSAGFIGFLYQRCDGKDACCETTNANKAHVGIDIWTTKTGTGSEPPSPKGNPVYAAAAGTIAAIKDGANKSAVNADGAPMPTAATIVITHDKTLHTLYAHMGNADESETYIEPTLRENAPVEQGQLLGHQGNAFGTKSPNPDLITHLHFEVKESAQAGKQLDPSPYLGIQVSRCQPGYPAYLDPFPAAPDPCAGIDCSALSSACVDGDCEDGQCFARSKQAGARCNTGGGICCNGTCVDTQTDGRHCGACGTTCRFSEFCIEASCQCPRGSVFCDICRNTDCDPGHCGACGQRCNSGETCVHGRCQAPPSGFSMVAVPASRPWIDTGIDVVAGSAIEIEASGLVRIAGSDPGKTPVGDYYGQCPVCLLGSCAGCPEPSLPGSSLVGRIANGTPFAVGFGTSLTAASSGRLFLSVNDHLAFFGDNSGEWTACVSLP